MSASPILVTIRRLPNGRGWRVSKCYPRAKGTACRGWHSEDGENIRDLVPFALRGLENELIRRGEARLPKVRQ